MTDIQNEITERLSLEKELTLAAFSERLWQSTVPVIPLGLDIYCRVDDPAVRLELSKNPRVGFIGRGPGSPVRGQGIARFVKDSAAPHDIKLKLGKDIILVRPYRIQLSGAQGMENNIFEETKNGWINEPEVSAGSRNRGIRFWLEAARIVSAPLSLIPVITGSIMALIHGRFDTVIFLAALFGGLAAHMGVNFYSDYNDFKKGFDTPGALSSHTGALTRELVKPSSILTASFICFGITGAMGIYLTYAAGWPVIIFGAAGLLGGASYTGGPAALKYRGMGELTTAVLMGPVMVSGAYYVQTGAVHAAPLVISMCLGLLVGSVTLANNIRDMEDDGKNGFVTLPIITGFENARKIYRVFLLAPYVILAVFIALWPKFYPSAIAFFSIPFALKCLTEMNNGGKDSSEIRVSAVKHPYPLYSIRLYIRFSILLSAGLLISIFS
jgi:1,4-dihydroxy-2-naphthoate octaprenyltransferase